MTNRMAFPGFREVRAAVVSADNSLVAHIPNLLDQNCNFGANAEVSTAIEEEIPTPKARER